MHLCRSHDTPDSSIPAQPIWKHSEMNDFVSASAQDASQLPSKPVPPSRPFTIHFKAILKGLTIGASLLPSLKAEYKACGFVLPVQMYSWGKYGFAVIRLPCPNIFHHSYSACANIGKFL